MFDCLFWILVVCGFWEMGPFLKFSDLWPYCRLQRPLPILVNGFRICSHILLHSWCCRFLSCFISADLVHWFCFIYLLFCVSLGSSIVSLFLILFTSAFIFIIFLLVLALFLFCASFSTCLKKVIRLLTRKHFVGQVSLSALLQPRFACFDKLHFVPFSSGWFLFPLRFPFWLRVIGKCIVQLPSIWGLLLCFCCWFLV